MRRLICIVSALCFASFSAPALAGPQDPLILSDSGTTPRWTAFEATSEGGTFEVRFDFETDTEPLGLGVFVFDAAHSFVGNFHATFFEYQDSYRYDVTVVPGFPLHGRETTAIYGAKGSVELPGVYLGGSPGDPRGYTVILYVIGDTEKGWSLTSRSHSGVKPHRDPATDRLITTNGATSFLYTTDDFEAPVHVAAQRSVPRSEQYPNGSGPGVRALHDGKLNIQVENAWLGSAEPLPGVQAYAHLIEAPDGSVRDCSATVVQAGGVTPPPCKFYSATSQPTLWGPPVQGPGTYELTLTGAGTGPDGPMADMLVWGIDPSFPTPPETS